MCNLYNIKKKSALLFSILIQSSKCPKKITLKLKNNYRGFALAWVIAVLQIDLEDIVNTRNICVYVYHPHSTLTIFHPNLDDNRL